MAKVKITVDNVAKLIGNIESLCNKQLLIGVPTTKTERKPEDSEQSPVNNAVLAYIHENGSPVANIPARPFLVPGVRAAKDGIVRVLRKAAKAATQLGSPAGSADDSLNAAGLFAVSTVQAYMTDSSNFDPLKDSTLAARKRRGRTGDKPLIDTGQLRRSITYVLRERVK